MAKRRGAFLAALLIAWVALGAAGVMFARSRGIAISAAAPVIAAFLIESPFYLVAGFPDIRERLAGPRLPLHLLASAVLPYLVCCCGGIPFRWAGLGALFAMALALSVWYRVLPAHPLSDLGYLTFAGAIIVSGVLGFIYPPFHKQHLEILGHISVVEIALLVSMLDRRMPETGFGFLPSSMEWRVGALHFLYFIILAFPINVALKATHLVDPRPVWQVVAVFLGSLWFQALSEEFFFRGLLQKWVEAWTGRETAALLLTAAIFGLIHYRLRGWKWVILVALLGWACGRARNQSNGIRAGTVTHALAVATWRAFFA
ncbi:MAG TPA: CPBP family intramembrane glutamic endopeptidase [Verrucomicrobiae bacterium]|nr:CPBP family intramembrane glutamic endopeptidase [Verrucomicrobiae bacterium]